MSGVSRYSLNWATLLQPIITPSTARAVDERLNWRTVDVRSYRAELRRAVHLGCYSGSLQTYQQVFGKSALMHIPEAVPVERISGELFATAPSAQTQPQVN